MEYQAAVESLSEYSKTGRSVGGFLSACLENNLSEAFGRADESSLDALHDIVRYIYNHVPMDAWGSKEKVQAWQARFA